MDGIPEVGFPVTIVAHDVGGIGGMERQLAELIGGLLRRGADVTVVSRTCELPSHSRLRHVRIPTLRRPFALAYPAFFVLASLVVRRHRRGVLHTTGAIIANRADVCTVHYVHEGNGTAVRRARRRTIPYRLNAAVAFRLSRYGERLVYRPRRSNTLVAVSDGLAHELSRAIGVRREVHVIGNGVDTSRFRPEPSWRAAVRTTLGVEDTALLALFVGGDWEGKGLSVAIEAVARAPAWHLVIVGDGDCDRYAADARRFGVSTRVVFAGARRDIEQWYAAADAFVVPSAYETFSLAAHEAAAAALPIIGTNVHGVRELLAAGAGIAVRREAREVADALRALEELALRRQLGAAGRAAAEQLDWDRVIDAYVHLYRRHGPIAGISTVSGVAA